MRSVLIFLQNEFGKPNNVADQTGSAYYVSNIFKEQFMKEKDTYSEVRTIEHGDIVARVHIPELTQEERDRRLKKIGQAASQLLLSKQIKR